MALRRQPRGRHWRDPHARARLERLREPRVLVGRARRRAPAALRRGRQLRVRRDRSIAEVEEKVDPSDLTSQRLLFAREGKLLVYHSAPFAEDTDVAGYFRLNAWLAIDQPDTDFAVSIYEITADGRSILLTDDVKRARYRESLRQARLVTTREPLEYTFDSFLWTARRIAKGSRLRLVIGPNDSIQVQKNYNSGKPVSDETLADARPVKVTLVHDARHPSALVVPLAAPAK
jgi:putative CocE/NonD family hydrolase